MSEQFSSQRRPPCDAYLNFLLILTIATQVDPDEYAAWVKQNAVKLCLGFDRSGEFDMCVYGRMQFSRAMGRGV